MKILFTLLLLAASTAAFSQDLRIVDNPYDNANEYTKSRNSFNRERWFYEQRMYPYNFIPEGAYQRAMEQRDALRNTQGFNNDNLAPWVNIGPTPGFYFNYGNISSRIVTIKYNPSNPNIIYLGAAFGGVWKSTNGGANWSHKSDFEVSLSSGSIAIDPANTNIIYYGTGEATYSGASYYGRGLLKSTNGGDTWTNYTSGLNSTTFCSRIVIRPNHTNEIFGAWGTAGLYRSTNSGVSWTQIIAGRCDDIVFTTSGDTAFIVGSGTGYRRSIDGGNSFNTIGGISMSTRNHIAICKTVPSVLYIAIHTGSTVNAYKSTNHGLNYTQVASNMSGGGQAWYDMYVHVNPFDPNYAYIGLIELFRTTNGGALWTNISNPSVHVDQHNMDFHPTDPNRLFCVNDGGVWSSTDRGNSWTNLNVTLTLTQFYRMTSDPSNANHLLGGTQDNGTQRTTGTMNWNAAFGGDGGEVCFQSQNPMFILGETQNNGVRRSGDGGNSWVSASSGLSGSGAWVGPIITHPTQAGVFYTARQQVFRTTNWGANWTGISSGTSGTIREMAISRSNPNIMYATSSSVVYKSTDAGTSYNIVSSGMPTRTITSIYVHPDSSNVVVVSFSGFGSGKVYKSTNGGVSWNNISSNLPDSPTNDVLIYYPGSSTSILLAAMDIGVFMTSNYGASWVELSDGLPNTVAMHLDYNQTANKVRIGTHGRGVWETSIVVGIVNYNNEMPDRFSLGQNYPNPFNPSTLIKFAIPASSYVTLKVYDMLGKEVRTLVNGQLNAGIYEARFDSDGLSSGLYFYRIEAGDFADVKKMVLVK